MTPSPSHSKLKYLIKLKVKGKEIGLKPYVVNTLGDVIYGLLYNMKNVEIKEQPNIFIEYLPETPSELSTKAGEYSLPFTVHVDEKPVEFNEFTANLFASTLLGFLSTLKLSPSSFEELQKTNFQIKMKNK